MNRRNPTRIELKLDDLQEYESLKKELDEKAKAGKEIPPGDPTTSTPAPPKSKGFGNERSNMRSS